MDVDSPKTWLGVILAGLSGVFAWSVKRNVKHMDDANKARDERLAELSGRVRVLETNVATRTDIEGVYDRINALGDTMVEHNTRVLELLAKSRTS